MTKRAAQCLFAEAAASAAPRSPLVIKILGLLNFLLLTAAVVMVIYCKHKKESVDKKMMMIPVSLFSVASEHQ